MSQKIIKCLIASGQHIQYKSDYLMSVDKTLQILAKLAYAQSTVTVYLAVLPCLQGHRYEVSNPLRSTEVTGQILQPHGL